jgi:ABC-type siderophore export system fused ATPase/permease subunit
VVRLVYGGIAFLGVLFILLGFLVTRFPLPATIIALVLYLGSNAVLALLDPAVLVQGIIFKIIVVVCLVKALQAAIAYQRELRAAGTADEYRS